jgi:hypothetical protein
MPKYYSFLVRIWQVDEPPGIVWRSSLENPQDHHLVGFGSLEALSAYLQTLTQLPENEPSDAAPSEPAH